ncbi:Zinc finger homeobox protein 3 [Fukomys damarensis]|uniref:Zinc finger homeobox protein 3 n=1 Tax=Fukomys damarensis TaxID=885580 RepID=A0A091CRN9_FUKDA|nr:Zinc finger homeobox protein 3 [Fukomys damarensis]
MEKGTEVRALLLALGPLYSILDSQEGTRAGFVTRHLQQHESGVEGESCYYHCVLCNYSTKAKLNLIQHVRSMKHQRSESLRKLQRLQKGLPEEDEDLGQIFTIRRCPSTDPVRTLDSVTVHSDPAEAKLCALFSIKIRQFVASNSGL